MKLLIVNADDFGLNASANAGIVACHLAGSVTSTTLMANGAAFDEAVGLAHENPSLGVGLHFNLTWGGPVADPAKVPALVDAEGQFHSRETLAKRSLLGRIPLEQVRLELEAQLGKLRRHGVAVTHIDSHQHVHAFGPVFTAVAERCQAERLPLRVPWVAPEQGTGLARRVRRTLLAALLRRSVSRWRGRVRWNGALGSVFDIGASGAALTDDDYTRVLAGANVETFELMVHPVASAAAMAGYTRVGAVGEAEYHWLLKGRLQALAQRHGFRLGTYRDLPA